MSGLTALASNCSASSIKMSGLTALASNCSASSIKMPGLTALWTEPKRYYHAAKLIDEIGRELGGWLRQQRQKR